MSEAVQAKAQTLLVEAEAQYKAAEEALKGLRDTLKREKRKDEKAMADAEKKRNKMKEALRHLEQRVQMREHLRSHRKARLRGLSQEPHQQGHGHCICCRYL